MVAKAKMTDTEAAVFYEKNAGNMNLWQGKARKIRARRGGASTVFTLRLTAEELQTITRKAYEAGAASVSAYIREAALRDK